MKVPLLLTLGLCLSMTMPTLAQPPAGQQQQQQDQKQTQQKNKTSNRDRTRQQAQPKVQQQERQRTQQQAQPQVRPQVRQQERQRTQQQIQPQVRQQERQRTQQQAQPQVRQQVRQQPQQQIRTQNRQRFTPPNAPPRETSRNYQQRYYRAPDGRFDRRPMYRNGTWYGRAAPNDQRFRLRQPFARGHFNQFGPRYYHRIVRFNRSNYWFWLASGYYFQIASWDWPYCSDWCWDCGDEFMVYLDPDHAGWYLVLNVQTGVYVHAVFMGR